MAQGPDKYVVDFPTLWVAIDWTEAHCVVPDRDQKGQPFVHYLWQLWCTVNWYRIKPTAKVGQLATAFFYRRAQIVGPQKCGKGPWSASIIVAQARGPVLFAGWAAGGEVYDCADHGCGCGWVYEYRPGEAMGRPWATPLIQLTATSDDQTDNVYDPLKAMLRYGPLSGQVTVGEEFTRLPNDGKIETVTSSALSRLGNPIIFALQDETQLYNDSNKLRKVAETQRRGAAGMGGRSMETTNPWDPSEDSVAQRTHESKRPDVFKFYRNPDTEPSLRHADGMGYKFTVARERRKVLQYVYAGSDHVDLDGIEAEALELMEKDPGQAERFYGNRIVAGLGTWLPRETWDTRAVPQEVAAGTQVVVGFDGSDVDDWTGFRCETREGYQFTPKFPDGRPMIWNPADYPGHQVPRLEVSAGLAHIVATYKVARLYADPPYWESECDAWAEEHGDTVVLRWYTRRVVQMHAAAERLITDVRKQDSSFTHDGCEITAQHVGNARKSPRGLVLAGESKSTIKYVLSKPGDGRKIDMAIPSILAHEAHGDVTSAGWPDVSENYVYF
jgi:hypothetical protein